MWLTSSSIGRKLVMSVTGACLVLFLTFHALMNGVAIFWPAAYNTVCEFLGANWYALVATAGLALLFIIHIIYACWLTIQNRRARGADRYAVTSRPKSVEWSSKNMFVLGVVIVAFLVVHLINFWAKMQWVEVRHFFTTVEGVEYAPSAGTAFLQLNFQTIWVPIVYLIGFVALWFHLTHGFWSMMQTCGWNNDVWMRRVKCIGNWWVNIVVGLFLVELVVFVCTAHCDKCNYFNNKDLQPMYEEMLQEFVDPAGAPFECGCPPKAPCPEGPCPEGPKCNKPGKCDKGPKCDRPCPPEGPNGPEFPAPGDQPAPPAPAPERPVE